MGRRARTAVRPAADFDRIYRNAYPRVYRTLAAILSDPRDAVDCTQEAFVRAFQEWEHWRNEAGPEVWVHKLAIGRATAYRRKAQTRRVAALLLQLGKPVAGDAEPDVDSEQDIVAALRKIHPRFAAPIVLRYYHGYTNREVAAALGISERTVVNHMRQANARLRATLAAPITVHPLASLALAGSRQADG